MQWLEEVPREWKVTSSNPTGHVAANFVWKMLRNVTCTKMETLYAMH